MHIAGRAHACLCFSRNTEALANMLQAVANISIRCHMRIFFHAVRLLAAAINDFVLGAAFQTNKTVLPIFCRVSYELCEASLFRQYHHATRCQGLQITIGGAIEQRDGEASDDGIARRCVRNEGSCFRCVSEKRLWCGFPTNAKRRRRRVPFPE